MKDIIEFLEGRIAEDERLAQRMVDEYASESSTADAALAHQLESIYDGMSRERNWARGQYIARVAAPSRILAECETKRAIMGLHQPYDHGGEHGDAVFCSECQWDHGDGSPRIDNQPVEGFGTHPCVTLTILAAVYDEHPDYLHEWKLQ